MNSLRTGSQRGGKKIRLASRSIVTARAKRGGRGGASRHCFQYRSVISLLYIFKGVIKPVKIDGFPRANESAFYNNLPHATQSTYLHGKS